MSGADGLIDIGEFRTLGNRFCGICTNAQFDVAFNEHCTSNGLCDVNGWNAACARFRTGWVPTVPVNPTPTPQPDANGCSNTNGAAKDSYGDTCEDYVGKPTWCGRYDTDDFKSNDMCCACNGGSSGTTPEPVVPAPVVPEPTVDPEPPAGNGECEDTSNGATDSYGDTCA